MNIADSAGGWSTVAIGSSFTDNLDIISLDTRRLELCHWDSAQVGYQMTLNDGWVAFRVLGEVLVST